MKKSFLFLSALFIVLSSKSQILQDWTQPVALTDSTSDNSNPIIVVWNDELYLFYNKYDEPYREIWWRKISEPMSEEQLLVGGWPEVDYRNPQIVFDNFLVFEMNPGGQYDLFGFRIDTSGVIGTGFQITNTEGDEQSFSGSLSYWEGICCWEGDGNIYVANPQIFQDTLMLTDIEIIDSGNCHDPALQYNYICWRKIENNESHIYYSETEWPNYQWSDPEIIIDTGDNINLSVSIIPEFFWGDGLCWEANNKIYFSDLDGGNWYYSPEMPGVEKYHDPTAFDLIWLSDNFWGVYSFVGETGTISDIYIVDEEASNYVLNITDDSTIDKSPRFFIGRPTYEYSTFYEIIDIWQKEINGNDVLYFSSALYNVVIGDVGENEMIRMNIFPNPVSGESAIHINFSEIISDDISISILNNNGQKADEIRVKGNNSNMITIIWNRGDLPAGVYFLVFKTKNETLTEKFIVL